MQLIEVGEPRALLRSAPVTTEAGVNEYYELWLQRNGDDADIEVHRFQFEPGQPARESRSLDVTWEAAARLLDDLRTALCTVESYGDAG